MSSYVYTIFTGVFNELYNRRNVWPMLSNVYNFFTNYMYGAMYTVYLNKV